MIAALAGALGWRHRQPSATILKFTKGAQKAVELGNFYHFSALRLRPPERLPAQEKAPLEPFGPAGLIKSSRLRGPGLKIGPISSGRC